ncbi:hypothetical protein PINS_up012358 [Pythium insidiosum]|nr:hypothetical protein PINS_up012358 [Pythium insidiosum]
MTERNLGARGVVRWGPQASVVQASTRHRKAALKKKLMAWTPSQTPRGDGHPTPQNDERQQHKQKQQERSTATTIQSLRAKAIDILRSREAPNAALSSSTTLPQPRHQQQLVTMAKSSGRERVRCPQKHVRVVEPFFSFVGDANETLLDG